MTQYIRSKSIYQVHVYASDTFFSYLREKIVQDQIKETRREINLQLQSKDNEKYQHSVGISDDKSN